MDGPDEELKRKYIEEFLKKAQDHVQKLKSTKDKQADDLEKELNERLQSVPRRLWDEKLRDILDMEREKGIEGRTFFQDFEAFKHSK